MVTIRPTLLGAAMKQYAASTSINAPVERIWAILTDGSTWTDWNPTVVKFEGAIAEGETVKVYPAINPKRAFPVKVRHMHAPRVMVWEGGMPLGLFRGTRTFELNGSDSGGVEFAMREVYSGPLSPLIGRSIPNLQPEFEKFAAALKARAEAG
ncbi:MAG: SRPBCC domain-containing protein [Dehalococcoidia bacterium]